MDNGTILSRQQRRALERQQMKTTRSRRSSEPSSQKVVDIKKFFREQRREFQTILKREGKSGGSAHDIMRHAFGAFTVNVDAQIQGFPPVECGKGCSSCCSIRVTATAPEIIVIADFLRSSVDQAERDDLIARLIEADNVTRGMDDDQRDVLARSCPFLGADGACRIYPVRPLGCRGHASISRRACIEAAEGKRETIPASLPHMQMRHFVQNLLQSVMKDAGLAWDQYEMNHALRISIEISDVEAQWFAGKDVLAPARDTMVSRAEMEGLFRMVTEHCR